MYSDPINYGGLQTTALLVFDNLAALQNSRVTSDLMAHPNIEGSMKTIQHHKAGYVPFPLLYPAPNLPDTGPVVEFYKKLRTSFRHEWLAEEPLVSTAFGWSEDSGFRATTNEYTWNPSDGWAQMETVDSDYLTLETAQWTCDDPYIRDWHLSYGNGLFLDEYLGGVPLEGNEPPSFYRPTGNIIGQWTTDQATHRIGSGEDHSEGHLITKPQPGTGYEPRSRRSEMFRMEGELLEPYTTQNLVQDAKRKYDVVGVQQSLPVVSKRDLVPNETKIELTGGRFRLAWNVPANLESSPGKLMANFVWKEIWEPESDMNPANSKRVTWRQEAAPATRGQIARTTWKELPPPNEDGTRRIVPFLPQGSITVSKVLFVNTDDDDRSGTEDRRQGNLVPQVENDLQPISFEAKAPGADEKGVIYRLKASGGGQVRLWEMAPGQSYSPLSLPYQLKPRDYTGGVGRPSYFIEATEPGRLKLELSIEVPGQELGNIATRKLLALLPIGVDDNIFATGVDDVSRTADPASKGYDPASWIMAPCGTVPDFASGGVGSACSNDTRLFVSPSDGIRLRITEPQPNLFNVTPGEVAAYGSKEQPETWPAVGWHGTAASSSDTYPSWSIIDNQEPPEAIDPKINVKVMKRRMVKVKLYLVDLTTIHGDRCALDPGLIPTDDSLSAHLNDIFAKQLNAWFDARIARNPDGTLARYFVDQRTDGDSFLNINYTSISKDQQEVLKQTGPAGASDIRVFMFAASGVRAPDGIGFGAASKDFATCWVAGQKTSVKYEGPEDVLSTIGHEIGHVLVGYGHPDDSSAPGDTPLLGTDRTVRLMCSGDNRDRRNGKLLVKAEWDAADWWLSHRPNGDN